MEMNLLVLLLRDLLFSKMDLRKIGCEGGGGCNCLRTVANSRLVGC